MRTHLPIALSNLNDTRYRHLASKSVSDSNDQCNQERNHRLEFPLAFFEDFRLGKLENTPHYPPKEYHPRPDSPVYCDAG